MEETKIATSRQIPERGEKNTVLSKARILVCEGNVSSENDTMFESCFDVNHIF